MAPVEPYSDRSLLAAGRRFISFFILPAFLWSGEIIVH
jgi:hypothetical protein